VYSALLSAVALAMMESAKQGHSFKRPRGANIVMGVFASGTVAQASG
jgi:hypothetical protein